MKRLRSEVRDLIAFLNSSPTMYHAAYNVAAALEAAGFRRLPEEQDWPLVPGGKYYVTRGGSAVIAFRVPAGKPAGFLMSASHSDHPCFKLKENGCLEGTFTRLATEKYGGMLIGPWLDRPLSIAGRVMVQTPQGIVPRLINIDRDLLLIPNVAIHLNRDANDAMRWNPAVDTLPLLGGKGAGKELARILEKQAGGRILGRDLYLYIRQKASVWGVEGEFLSAAALDDLECAWGCLQGFLNAGSSESIGVYCLFDSEEVGSCSVQGAASPFLQSTLSRVCAALDLCLPQALAQSFMVSADNAQALHPNHPELFDSANAPVLNGGIVLKFQASQSYTTDGIAAAVFRTVCENAGVRVQTYHNRADLRGGSTLGHISLTHIPVPTADVGLPQLAMHSCFETAGTDDVQSLEKAMAAYYSSTLEIRNNTYLLR